MATEASPLEAGRNRRVLVVVGLAAAVAVAAIVGVTFLQTRGDTTTLKAQKGLPPLELAFGVESGQQAQTLARAQNLYNRGEVEQAAALFARYRSPAAQIGSAFAAWASGNGVQRLQQLSTRYPNSPLVVLHLGLAYYWAGRTADAVTEWEQAARLGRDSPYGVDAETALHPTDVPGLPPIVTGLEVPKALAKLPAVREFAALKRSAAEPDVRAKLLYGAALWNYLQMPVSAEREFAAAAKLAPGDELARALAAVGLFSKANPVRAFGKLGPLTAVFPHSAVVEFHLGVLLLYIDKRAKAAEHLRAALADGPHSPYAKPAMSLLASLAGTRPK